MPSFCLAHTAGKQASAFVPCRDQAKAAREVVRLAEQKLQLLAAGGLRGMRGPAITDDTLRCIAELYAIVSEHHRVSAPHATACAAVPCR